MENSELHPENGNDVLYWAKKWGVSKRQIFDAVLETGSLRLIDIKQRLRKKGELHFLPGWMYRLGRLV